MIVFAHLLNDRSGSPRVLRSVISALAMPGDGSRLMLGSDGDGSLSDVTIPIFRYWYWRAPSRLITLLTFSLSQCFLLLRLLFMRGMDRDTVVYVNTLLPFGAALYGWMTGRRVVYHLHEVSIKPAILQKFLTAIASRTASELIYVSDYHRRSLPIRGVTAHTIHNALDDAFLARASSSLYKPGKTGCFNVLMLASLRDYKGVPEFLTLAGRLEGRTEIRFELVCNEECEAISHYFGNRSIPNNVTVNPRTDEPENYYEQASLVINLSRPDQWIETFGLTLLEAMSFGVPVIAPPFGGPAEIISDGAEGYLISAYDIDRIAGVIVSLSDNHEKCMELSSNARRRSADFTLQQFGKKLREVIGD